MLYLIQWAASIFQHSYDYKCESLARTFPTIIVLVDAAEQHTRKLCKKPTVDHL